MSKKLGPFVISALLVLLSIPSLSAADQLARYGPYVVSHDRIESLEIFVETDIGTVSENLVGFDAQNEELLNAIRPITGDSVFRAKMNGVLREVSSDTSLGHIAPYIVSSALFVLNQYYTNNQLRSRSRDPRLTDVPVLNDRSLTFVVISDRQKYEEHLVKLGAPSGAQAYFDARSSSIIFHFDPRLLRHFAFQEKWDEHSPSYFVDELTSYIMTLFLYEVTHEFFHFIQNASASPYYKVLALREGSAVFSAVDLSQRFRLQELILGSRSAGLQREDDCTDPPAGRTFTLDGADQYFRVARFLRSNPQFSVTRWALEESATRQFFEGDIELQYALSLVLYKFLLSIEGEAYSDWKKIYSVALSGDDISDVGRRFDLYFTQETLRDTGSFFGHANINLDDALFGVSLCFRSDPATALIWATKANSIIPGLPVVGLYVGDIFANTPSIYARNNVSITASTLSALYYYRQALVGALQYWKIQDESFCVDTPKGNDQAAQVLDMLRLYSRVGEAYSAIGSIDNAIKYFECAVDYSNRLLVSDYASIGVRFLVTTISADLELNASRKIIDNDFQFSREKYREVSNKKSSIKNIASDLNVDFSKPEQVTEYVQSLCLAYALAAVSLDANLSAESGSGSWRSDISLCAAYRWEDGAIKVDRNAMPKFR